MKVVIILIAPQMGENIGAFARAMSNFDLEELRIIQPRDGWPNPKAEAMAASGIKIINNAQIYESFPAAIADLNYVFATGDCKRDLPQPVYTPYNAAKKITSLMQGKQKLGIVFGRESTGMHNNEIAACQAMISIPCSATNTSCNIAQAGAIICYEIYQNQICSSQLVDTAQENLATQQQLDWLLNYLYDNLSNHNFFPTKERAIMAKQNLTSLLATANLTAAHAQLLSGIFKSLIER